MTNEESTELLTELLAELEHVTIRISKSPSIVQVAHHWAPDQNRVFDKAFAGPRDLLQCLDALARKNDPNKGPRL